jgi:hypothetical protein
MRSLLPIIVATLCFSSNAPPSDVPLNSDARTVQGLWFGTGNVHQFVLMLQEDRFIVTNRMGSHESTYTLNPTADLPAIDLVRSDGKIQRGVYRLDGAVLQLTLADPELKRPSGKSIRLAGGVSHAHYRFTRQPGTESFETLVTKFPKELLNRIPPR